MAKPEKPPVEQPASPTTPQRVKVLCLPSQVASVPREFDGVESIELRRGTRVNALLAGKVTEPVTYNGDLLAFVQQLGVLMHPTGVRTRTEMLDREVFHDDAFVMAKVPQHTVFLVDG